MIKNLTKFYGGLGAIISPQHKITLRATKFNLIDPIDEYILARAWGDWTITSGYRSHEKQAQILANTPGKAAKKLSQHELGEAFDFVGPNMEQLYKWIFNRLRWWQLIVYFESEAEGEPITAKHMHLSTISQVESIQRKALYNVNGTWKKYKGEFIY